MLHCTWMINRHSLSPQKIELQCFCTKAYYSCLICCMQLADQFSVCAFCEIKKKNSARIYWSTASWFVKSQHVSCEEIIVFCRSYLNNHGNEVTFQRSILTQRETTAYFWPFQLLQYAMFTVLPKAIKKIPFVGPPCFSQCKTWRVLVAALLNWWRQRMLRRSLWCATALSNILYHTCLTKDHNRPRSTIFMSPKWAFVIISHIAGILARDQRS